MRATVMYGAGDVRVEDVRDARLIDPTDALVRVTRSAICGSDLWPYKSMPHDDAGRRMGHEFIGIVEAVGPDVAVERVRELTEHGAHSVMECVGLEQAVETALTIARPGGAIGRVGVPEHDTTPTGVAFWKNASIAGGPAPVRAYIEELLPDVLEGRIEPGRVFDRTGSIEDVPDGYRAMNDREVLKFQIKP
jgi:threonine dehydrogenase-like Zn-dependent dehydrogenase